MNSESGRKQCGIKKKKKKKEEHQLLQIEIPASEVHRLLEKHTRQSIV